MKLKEVGEVAKSLKHGRQSKIYCPICGSPEISLLTSYNYMLGPGKYVCKNCGYCGPIIMELEKEER